METVNFLAFLEEKISVLLLHLVFLLFVIMTLMFSQTHGFYIVLLLGLFVLCEGAVLVVTYMREKKEYDRIVALTDGLEEKYYVAEVLPKPRDIRGAAYYYALKEACRAMNGRIGALETEQREYREYVESFVHEIKIPISALSLTFDNNRDYALKKEADRANLLVEQMLYYARSGDTEKDYFVRKLSLEEAVHGAVLRFRHYLLERGIKVETSGLDVDIYTDEKWLGFILAQIIQNAVKYSDPAKPGRRLAVSAREDAHRVLLYIEDNGRGIPEADLPRIFEKGFTGADRKKKNATGMGLYLSKKLCRRLGLEISVDSVEKEYTRVCICFPKSGMREEE